MKRCLMSCNKVRSVAMQHKRCCNESARITAVSTFWGFENALISPIKSNGQTLPRSHCVHDRDAQVWAMRDDGARWQGCDADYCTIDVERLC